MMAQAHDSERRAIAAGDAHHSVADQVASVRASTQEVVKAAHTKKESKLSLQHHASEAANIAAESAIVSVIAAESVKAAAYAGKNSTAKDGAAEQLRESKYALHTAMASADKHFHIMMHDDTFVPLPPTKKVVAEQIETADVPLSVGQMADLRKIGELCLSSPSVLLSTDSSLSTATPSYISGHERNQSGPGELETWSVY